ncbi:MAG: GHKL domain-containing protein [Lachnospiraceae bacterium]|nr:GHKL domain-containing protein [Lachnospiraceae bacterium]
MKYGIIIVAGIAGIILLVFLCRAVFIRLVDKRISAYQNDLVEKHYEEVENMYRQMRGWRHDYKHHIQTMKAHLLMEQYQELNEYLSELDTDLTEVDTVLRTGNVRIDAVLNSKLAVAKARGIRVNAKATVPEQLRMKEVDLCVIIGNLLDNAMEACDKLEKEKQFIRVYIEILKEQLYIYVSNSMADNVRKSGGQYLSTKRGSHGFGLMRIDRVVKKYNGYLNRQHEEGVFATEIMLPLL